MKKISRRSFLQVAGVAALTVTAAACSSETASSTATSTTTSSTASSDDAVVEDVVETIDYPTSPIEVVVPWSAGGAVDIMVRQLVTTVSQDLGAAVAVVNTVGASGTLAATEYLQANADGYTLLVSSFPVVCFQPYIREIEYTLDDFTAVIGLHDGKYVVCTCPDASGLESLDDIIEKGTAGTVLFGTGGIGTFDDVYGAAMLDALGVSYELVPFDDSISIQNAILNGSIDAGFGAVGNFEEQAKAGNLLPLAAMTEAGLDLEDIGYIDSLTELGYDVSGIQQFFILGRAGTDPAVIEILYNAFLAAMDNEEFKELAANSNWNMNPMTSAEMDDMIYEVYDFAGETLQ